MRNLEIAAAMSAAATLFWASFASQPAPGNVVARWLSVATIILSTIQIRVEGYRPQMLPVYLLSASLPLLCWQTLAATWPSRLSTLLPVWLGAALLLGTTAVAAGIVNPVFEFSPLTGKNPVGVRSFHLSGSGRVDPYGTQKGAQRELMVEAWYPASNEALRMPLAAYRDGRSGGAGDRALALVRTRSHPGAPLATGLNRFPVLLFSGPANRFQNTYETEDLASHGYIVIGIDHPADSDRVDFPDSRMVWARKANTFLNFDSAETYAASQQEVQFDLQVRFGDVEQVIDALEHWQTDHRHPFFGRLDLSRIGMLGHSFGGAVTAEVCHRDPRVRAGVNMDGWMFGESQKTGVQQPFFFMSDATPRPSEADLHTPEGPAQRMAIRTEQGYEEIENSLHRFGGYYLQVPGLEHMNFSDIPLYSRLKARTGAGRIDARRAHAIVFDFTLAFFDRWLRDGGDDAFARAQKRFPEVHFQCTPRPHFAANGHKGTDLAVTARDRGTV